MARIAGVDIPREKRLEVSLTYIFGIGRTRSHQVCQATDDPEQWLITSEWESVPAFEAWERSPGHRDLVKPLRDCITERRSQRFLIHKETRRSTSVYAVPGLT